MHATWAGPGVGLVAWTVGTSFDAVKTSAYRSCRSNWTTVSIDVAWNSASLHNGAKLAIINSVKLSNGQWRDVGPALVVSTPAAWPGHPAGGAQYRSEIYTPGNVHVVQGHIQSWISNGGVPFPDPTGSGGALFSVFAYHAGERVLKRREWRGWELVALATVVTAAATALTKEWPTAVVVSAVAAAGSAAVAVLISRAKANWDRRAQESSQLESHLLVSESGLPPRVRDLSNPVALGVHPAGSLRDEPEPGKWGRIPAFVPREVMAALRRELVNDSFVILVGESTAGKSRAAYEAIRLFPDHRVIFPKDRNGLNAAVRVILSQRRSILWLDDLDRFLGPTGIDAHMVQRLLSGRRDAVIVASMRTQEHAKYMTAYSPQAEETGVGPLVAGPEILQVGRDVIDLATVIRVERRWSPADLTAAREYSDDPRIADAVAHADHFGVAEYLAAAPQLHGAWEDAWSPGGFPRGAALVAAAVDTRRCGWRRPMPQCRLACCGRAS